MFAVNLVNVRQSAYGPSDFSHLPHELICDIIPNITDLDHLLRLSCVNETMRSMTAQSIDALQGWDNLLMNSLAEVLKLEVLEHTGLSLHFEEISHEPGKAHVRGFVGRAAGFHFITSGNRVDLERSSPVTTITIRNGYVRLRGGLSFRFPGQHAQKEIELLATMNEIGMETVVLSSLDGNCIISAFTFLLEVQ